MSKSLFNKGHYTVFKCEVCNACCVICIGYLGLNPPDRCPYASGEQRQNNWKEVVIEKK